MACTHFTTPYVDIWTFAALTLLLPLLTMGHELAGHAPTRDVTGHLPSEIGAYYIECPGAAPRPGATGYLH